MPVKSSAGTGAARARRTAPPIEPPKSAARRTSAGRTSTGKTAAGKKAKAGKTAKKTTTPKKAKIASKTASKIASKDTEKPAAATTKMARAVRKKKSPATTLKCKTPPKGDATCKLPPTTTTSDVPGAIDAPHELTKAGEKSGAKRKAAPKPISLVLKVLGTIDGELSKLEQHTGKSSQDRERASRALSQMVTSLEKAVAMQRQMARDKGTGSKDKEVLRHAEDMRRQIAERIERLNDERAAGKRGGGSSGNTNGG